MRTRPVQRRLAISKMSWDYDISHLLLAQGRSEHWLTHRISFRRKGAMSTGSCKQYANVLSRLDADNVTSEQGATVSKGSKQENKVFHPCESMDSCKSQETPAQPGIAWGKPHTYTIRRRPKLNAAANKGKTKQGCMIHGDVMSTHARSTMLRALIHNVNGT